MDWVLLSYRVPREPSTPRITVWRKLERLGVARLGDGLVGLPADARTKEQIEWVAEEIVDAGGTATVWLASTGQAQERAIAAAMRAARVAEYQSVIEQARQTAPGPAGEVARTLRRLRAELRRIQRRDFFPPEQQGQAAAALDRLADQLELAGHSRAGRPADQLGTPADRAGASR